VLQKIDVSYLIHYLTILTRILCYLYKSPENKQLHSADIHNCFQICLNTWRSLISFRIPVPDIPEFSKQSFQLSHSQPFILMLSFKQFLTLNFLQAPGSLLWKSLFDPLVRRILLVFRNQIFNQIVLLQQIHHLIRYYLLSFFLLKQNYLKFHKKCNASKILKILLLNTR
jgi:hypothetical protein